MAEIRAQLEPVFLMIVSGSSRCGKSEFVKRLIQTPSIFARYPDRIIVSYQTSPEEYVDLLSNPRVSLCEGLPDFNAACSGDDHKLIVLDDATLAISDKKNELVDVFCIRSHHANVSVCLILHNPFLPEVRTIRLQAGYHVFFRNTTDSSYIQRFATQSHPGRAQVFLDAYRQATAEPYSYLLYDAHPNTEDKFRLRSHLLDTPQHVYIEQDGHSTHKKRRYT